MSEVIKNLKSRITMIRQQTLFWDKINGKAVNEYIDCYGNIWMAQSKFGSRVLKSKAENE
ncbi:MAG: hypothetical protein RIE52_11995 [Balneola sp.]